MERLFHYLKPYRFLLFVIFLLAIGQSSANLYLPNLMSDIVNNGIAAFDTNYIWRTGGIMVLVAIGGTLCSIIGMYFSTRVATGMVKTIRTDIFRKVQNFSLHEFDILNTSSLITRTTNDTIQIQQLMVIMLGLLITAPITLVVGVVLALNQDLALSWIIIIIIPIIVTLVVVLLFKAVPLFTLIQTKLDRLNLILDENLIGVRVIRAFNKQKHEEERFDTANRDLTNIAISVNRLIAIMMPIMMLIINLSTIAIIWFGSLRVAANDLQIGAMFAFLQYTMQILISLLMVALMFIMIPRAQASAKRINEVLAMEPEIKDPPQTVAIGKKRGFVEFQDVTFNYFGAEKPALQHISFKAVPGQTTAIIGGTGSGKSTLVNLIMRFYDLKQGKILVDGVDVRQISQQNLRARIGFVPQKAILFAGTVNENLLFGKENATYKEIEHATKIAQAYEFIKKLPKGFNSPIAQGGTNISGGQMQRLSIARALIRKPEIYIFDDAFSALDFKTDAKLRAALKAETRQSTVIIVAQRVSTIMDADQIIVLDEGRVAGQGKHQELMKNCEVYRDIVSSQLSQVEISQKIK